MVAVVGAGRASSGAVTADRAVTVDGAGWGVGEPVPAPAGEALAAARARATELVEALRAEADLPGVSVSVGMAGRVVWSGGAGLADLELSSPATGDTVYRLASVSKPITAVAVAKLIEDGVIDADEPIHSYLPEYPAHARGITMRMLLGHTSGIRDYKASERDGVAPPREWASASLAIGLFQNDPLEAEPGERYKYTTLNYILAAAVMERVTGRRFAELVDDAVLAPAGMTRTGLDTNTPIVGGRAGFYVRDASGRAVNAPFINTSYKPAGGGLIGSTADLCRMMLALHEGRLIDRASMDTMWTPGVTNDGARLGYAMGWDVDRSSGRPIVGHNGRQIGTSTTIMLDTAWGVCAAVFTNMSESPMGPDEAAAFMTIFERAGRGEVLAVPNELPTGVFRMMPAEGSGGAAGVITLRRRYGRVTGEGSVPMPGGVRHLAIATAFGGPDGLTVFAVDHQTGVHELRMTRAGGEWTCEVVRRGEPRAAFGLRPL